MVLSANTGLDTTEPVNVTIILLVCLIKKKKKEKEENKKEEKDTTQKIENDKSTQNLINAESSQEKTMNPQENPVMNQPINHQPQIIYGMPPQGQNMPYPVYVMPGPDPKMMSAYPQSEIPSLINSNNTRLTMTSGNTHMSSNTKLNLGGGREGARKKYNLEAVYGKTRG